MADIHKVYDEIEKRIKWLEETTGKLKKAADEKALAIGEYDKAIAIATAKLALGTVKEVLGIRVDGKPPATIIKKLAEGMCHEEQVAQIVATNEYKSVLTKIEVLEATLNGQQSLFRHLS